MRWFPPTVWARLLRTGTLKRWSAGERILARGAISDGVFVVAQGSVRFAGNRLSSGEFFAEESALMQCPVADDAVMETDGAVVCFARADILELLAEYDAPRTDSPQRLDLDEFESEAGGNAARLPGPASACCPPGRRPCTSPRDRSEADARGDYGGIAPFGGNQLDRCSQK